jgi:MFS family permease
MKLFYGCVLVGAAMVITCVGYGATFTLGVFVQPMAAVEGWSRTGISTAALLNFLSMGLGSFVWGALSDRFGTRAVVLTGGVLLGLGTVLASRAPTADAGLMGTAAHSPDLLLPAPRPMSRDSSKSSTGDSFPTPSAAVRVTALR